MTVVLAAAAAVLFGCGTYLLLQRELTRIVLGLALLAHGANLFILLGAGRRGEATFIGESPGRAPDLLDPLPQAFVLTAIVITFGVTTFLLGLAYRSWVLTHDDIVQDDVEDRRVGSRRRTVAEEVADMAQLEAAREDQVHEEAERHQTGRREDQRRGGEGR
jgi:multicomponent Na+:H+ antiporter subunit C